MKVNDRVKHFDANTIGVVRRVLPDSDVIVEWDNNTRSTERQLDLLPVSRND